MGLIRLGLSVKMASEGTEGTDDEPASSDIIVISPTDGDLILEVTHGKETFCYRVNVQRLVAGSTYFSNLLSGSFVEAIDVQSKLARLDRNSIAKVTADALPHVHISDLGRISRVSSIRDLVRDFLNAVHGHDIQKVPPIPNFANLAIVADRFDCLGFFTEATRRYLSTIDARASRKSEAQSEERNRQRILLGVFLDHGPWVPAPSKRLIVGGSICWTTEVIEDPHAALWWDLPHGLEEELICRREYLLETIESLQSHFLKLYSSSERQCKLGYDTSLQCDSYQLGEMVRFFQRINTLRLEGTLSTKDIADGYSGDIERLLEAFHGCPSYQIDRNHSHCGLRTRLVPILEALDPLIRSGKSIGVGICGECWRKHRAEYAWTSAKRPVSWSRQRLVTLNSTGIVEPGSVSCLAHHLKVREMFMATERDWTSQDDGRPIESKITLGLRKI